MVIGKNDDAIFLASDINALSSVAKEFTLLEDYELVLIKNNDFSLFSAGKKIERESQEIETMGQDDGL